MGDEKIMQTTGAGQASFERGIQHAGTFAQQIARCAVRERGLKLPGADTGPAGEFTLEMGGGEADGVREAGKVWPVAPCLPQILKRISHAGIGDGAFRERRGEMAWRVHEASVPEGTRVRHPILAG